MKNKAIHYIKEDPYENGFYILCSREYDQRLELVHTHRAEIFMDFERQVEPGIIKIFDMNILKADAVDQSHTQQIESRFIGMRDDEFYYDLCRFIETKVKNPDATSS